MDISQIYILLRQLGFETSIEKLGHGIPPVFVATSNEGLIGLRSTDEGGVSLDYLTFEEETARRTLYDCPEIIQHWYNQLDNLIEVGEYKQMPIFKDVFTPDQALEICFHLGSRMMDQISQTRYSL